MHLLNILTSAVAALAALWIMYHAWRELIALKNDSRQLTHDLEVAEMVLEHVKRREEFASSFDATTGELLKLEIFGPVWDEFRESLDVDAEHSVVRSARDPYEFLGPRLLDASAVDQRRIEAVPNRLVALGLIFTFIGLVLSLAIAGIGLSEDDPDKVRAALTALLFAAAFKFITSIAGIASSIWFTQKRSELLNRIDALSATIGRQLDRLTQPLRADIVAEKSHRELVLQSELLGQSQTNLAGAIAAQLDATLRANLASAIQPVADRIGEMGRTIATMNQQALHDMVAQFSKELGSEAREHSKRMMELFYQVEQTVQKLPDSIEKAAVAIETAGGAFSDATAAAVRETEQRLTQAGHVLAEVLTDTEKNLGSASLALGQVADLLAGTIDRIERTESTSAERAQRAQETLRVAVEQIARVLDRTDTAVAALAPLAPLVERLELLSDSLAKANETSVAVIARSEELLATSRSAGEVLSRTAATYADTTALSQVIELLSGALDRIGQTESASSERALRSGESLQAAVEQISRLLDRTDATVAALAPLAPMAARLEQVAGSLAQGNEASLAMIARSEEVLAASRSAGEMLSRTAASYSDSTVRLEESLTSLFEQLAAGIDLFRSRVGETVERLDEDAARIARRLSGGDGGSTAAAPRRARGKK